MSTDSMRDSANSMSPPLGNDRYAPGSSSEQRNLSTDSTRDSGIDPDDPQKSSLAAYLPCNILSFFFYFTFLLIYLFIVTANKYFILKKRRYMFSGAEVDISDMNDDSETESDSSEKSETPLN